MRSLIYREKGYKLRLLNKPLVKREILEHLNLSFCLLDKPRGPTSHEVAAWIKKIFEIPTAHSGTLDPAVSGLLIILFGKTRKVSDLISKFDKEYICEMQLHDFVSESKIIEVFNKFIGDIYQKPPLRAAVKKSPRIRRIYSIEVLDIVKRNILFKAKVQAGTYIRKLCFDIGEILGCGAHMTELRRTKIGPFSEDDERVATLHELVGAYKEWKNNKNEKYLRAFTLPIEELLDFLPKIYIKDTAIFSITHGSYVAAPGVIAATNDLKMNSYVTINTERNEIIAIGISTVDLSKLQKMDKGMVAKIDKVISFTQTAGSGI